MYGVGELSGRDWPDQHMILLHDDVQDIEGHSTGFGQEIVVAVKVGRVYWNRR